MDIFQIAKNDNFFSILSSQNKLLHWNIVCEFYKAITSTPERRISRFQTKMMVDEILLENKTTNTDGNDLIKRLLDCGWIVSQYDSIHNCDYISFTQYAMEFIHFNYNYIQNNNSIKTSEILNTIMYIINEMIKPTDEKSEIYLYPYKQGLLRIKNLTIDLTNELYNIISKIRNSINNISNTNDMQIFVDNLKKYLIEVDNGYIANMYKNSNITITQKNTLIDLITNIKGDAKFQERILQDMKNTYFYQSNNSLTDEMLFDEFCELLDTVQSLFCNEYQECRRKIESLKVDILNRAITKLQLLSSDKSSNVAKVNHIIGLLEKVEENDDYIEETINELFKLKEHKVISHNSLYDRGTLSSIEAPKPIVTSEITDEEFHNSFHDVPDNSKQANRFAKQLLGNKKEVQIKDIDAKYINEIISIGSYADYPNCEYTIEITNEKIKIGNVLTNNFIIRSK